MKLIIRLFNLSISVLLVVLAALVAYISIPAFGNQALIVRSGSMKPAIGVGDLVVVRAKQILNSPATIPIPKYKTGDIVAFKTGNDKTLVTHRIALVKIENDKIFYQTKGDGNKQADKLLVPEEQIVGAKFLTLPKVGRIVAFTKSNIGFPLLVIFPAVLVIIFEIWGLFGEIKRQRRIIEFPPEKSHVAVHLSLILPILVSVLIIHSTFAYFSDSETSTNNTFVASSSFPSPTPSPSSSPSPSPSPAPPPIAQTLVVNEFLWNSSCGQNATAKARNYWIELYNGSGSTINLKDWIFRDGSGSTIQISNSNKFLSAGGYIVITKDGSVFNGCYILQDSPEQANLGGNQDFLPATTGGVVRLESPDGSGGFIVVDRVEYGPALNSGVLNTAADQSIARSPNGVDSALGDTFAVSDFAVDTTPSSGVAN